jgi:hypothetical protein
MTTSQTATVRDPVRQLPVFYLVMAGVFAVIAFAGFTRTYLLPVVMQRFDGPALVHLHAILLFGWTGLLAWQSALVRHRRIAAHRAWGMAGISLATGVVFTAVALVVRGLDTAQVAGNFDRVRLPAIAPLSQIALFGAFVAAAVASIRRPDVHRRLMLLATANLLPPAVARLFGVVLGLVLAPANTGRPNMALVTEVKLAFAVTLAAGLVADLLIGVAIAYDWRMRGRPHSAYVIGGACMLLVQFLRKPLAYTELWRWITDGLLALAH